MNKNKIAKIIVPVFMILGIISIYVMQNIAVKDEIGISNNLDFELIATEIDMQQLQSYELPIIIDFGADECVPCKAMEPVLIAVNEEMQNKAIIKFIDVWENPEIAAYYPVQVIPTQLIINADGTPYIPSEDIKLIFSMYGDKETGEHIYTTHQGGLTQEQMKLILADMGVL